MAFLRFILGLLLLGLLILVFSWILPSCELRIESRPLQHDTAVLSSEMDLGLVEKTVKDVAVFKTYLVEAHEHGCCLDKQSYLEMMSDCDLVIKEGSYLVDYWSLNTRLENEVKQAAVLNLAKRISQDYQVIRRTKGCDDDKLTWAAAILAEDVEGVRFRTRLELK